MFTVECKRTRRVLGWDIKSRQEADAVARVITAFGSCCPNGDHVVIDQDAANKARVAEITQLLALVR